MDARFLNDENKECKYSSPHIPLSNTNEVQASQWTFGSRSRDCPHETRMELDEDKKGAKSHKHDNNKKFSMESSGRRNIAEKGKAIVMQETVLFEAKETVKGANPTGNITYSSDLNELWASNENRHGAQGSVADEGIGIECLGNSCGRRTETPSSGPDVGPDTVALHRQAHSHYITEETRPGAVRVAGFEGDERAIEIGKETVATREESTVHTIAQIFDMEGQNWRLHQQERVLLEHDHIMDKAVIVDPVVVADRDVENTNEEVTRGAANGGDSLENNGQKCSTRVRRWSAIGAILLIMIAIAVALAIVLPPQTPLPADFPCSSQMADGSLVCHWEDYPEVGFRTDFFCLASAPFTSECTTCAIIASDNATQCNSCTICSNSVAYDCSNVGEGNCFTMDCNGYSYCSPGLSPTPPNPSTSVPTDGEDDVVYGLQPSCNSADIYKYNMCLDLESLSGSYESWMEGFAKAAQRWESVIVGNLPSISSSELDTDPQLRCTGYPLDIDDVYICGREADIDGLGGILGYAIPIYIRGSGIVNTRTGEEYQVTLTGIMEFDSADILDRMSNGELDELVFHEMGHVVGFGALWEANGLYVQGSGEYATGTHADDEWKAIGCSGPLPVELHGGDGTAEGHWDEDCFGNELMTGFFSGSSQPLSRITIGAFEDMGYEVDYSQADLFTTADLGVCVSSCPEARRELRRNDRKMKANLGSEDRGIIMRYAKTKLTNLHKEFEIAAAVHGDCHDGIKAVEELAVLYEDAKGHVHTVHVTWDEVNDLDI